jgi:hypothetical protein
LPHPVTATQTFGMVALAALAFSVFLLATNPSRRNINPSRSSSAGRQGTFDKEGESEDKRGRNRYDGSGKKAIAKTNRDATSRQRQGNGRRSGSSSNSRSGSSSNTSSKTPPRLECIPPPLTDPNGPWPTYYSCRHTYEDTLMDEIQREVSRSSDAKKIVLHSPYPGLVRVDDPSDVLSKYYDPVYALQKIPEAVVVQSDSTKGLAKAVYSALLGSENTSGDEETTSDNKASEDSRCREVHALLRLAPRGSLAIHGLVPGMCKGQPNPVMLNRSQRVAAELSNMLRKRFAAARKQNSDEKESPQPIVDIDNDIDIDVDDDEERWVLQVLLMSPDVAVASLIKCTHIGPGKSFWPNWQTPMGMSQVDIVGEMPTSAYRKLMEAFECMRIRPEPFKSHAVDLGACPGGWTSVLRMLDCHVVSVDRSKLDPVLMNDDMVEFVKGDAFAFAPTAAPTATAATTTTSNNRPSPTEEGVAPEHTWMVSDVIAYPERVIELLERWCGGRWAKYLIVTMKFQGDKPALDDLDHAIDVVESHGYHCRAKHFFNNKNEVTLMIHEKKRSIRPRQLDDGVLGSAMYKPILP